MHWVFLALTPSPSGAVILSVGTCQSAFSGRLSRLSMLANGNPGFAMVLLTVSRASHLSCATTSGDGGPSFTVVPGFSSSRGLCVLIRHRLWYGRRHYVMWPLLISGLPCLLGVFQLDRLLALRVPHCVCLVHIWFTVLSLKFIGPKSLYFAITVVCSNSLCFTSLCYHYSL